MQNIFYFYRLLFNQYIYSIYKDYYGHLSFTDAFNLPLKWRKWWLNKINEINEEKYHEILIKNNVPYSPYDLQENKSLLLENNFDKINAISWEKGCYVGQEITARMKYRALLKKRIYSLVVKAGSPKADQTIKVDGIDYGKIISIENDYVLAMLKIELAEIKIKSQKKIKTNDGLVLDFIS